MPKTRKATRRMKKRKLTRRQPRKMRGGVLTDVQQKAIFISDMIINKLDKNIALLERKGWGSFGVSFSKDDYEDQVTFKTQMEPYRPGLEYLIEHMEQKQNDKTFKKSLQETFTKEKLAPYAETIYVLAEFESEVYNLGHRRLQLSLDDSVRLKKRFEKIKEEIQSGK